MRITEEKEFVCSYSAVHLNKRWGHITKLSKVRNKPPDVGLHFLKNPQDDIMRKNYRALPPHKPEGSGSIEFDIVTQEAETSRNGH